MSQLAQKIRAARLAAEMTQAELAERLEVTRAAVTQWESRDPVHRTQPSVANLRKVADVTKLPLTYFVEEKFRVIDLAHVRSLFAAGEWQDMPAVVESMPPGVTVPTIRAATLVEPLGAFYHANAPDTEWDEREPDPFHNRSLPQLFWDSVRFDTLSEQPELQSRFDVVVKRGSVAMRADFLINSTVVEFIGEPTPRSPNLVRNRFSNLLLIEHILGRRLRKILMFWTPGKQSLPAPLAQFAEDLKFEAETFDKPFDAAAFLRLLAT